MLFRVWWSFPKIWIWSKRNGNFTVPDSIPRQENSLPPFSTPAHTPCQDNKNPSWGISPLTLYQPNPYEQKKIKIGHSPSIKRKNITPPIRTTTNISNKYVLLRLGTRGNPFNFSDNFKTVFSSCLAPQKNGKQICFWETLRWPTFTIHYSFTSTFFLTFFFLHMTHMGAFYLPRKFYWKRVSRPIYTCKWTWENEWVRNHLLIWVREWVRTHLLILVCVWMRTHLPISVCEWARTHLLICVYEWERDLTPFRPSVQSHFGQSSSQ